MRRRTAVLAIIIISFIFTLHAQTYTEPEIIHEQLYHGSINETEEILLQLIYNGTNTITGFCIRNSEVKSKSRGSFSDDGESIELVEMNKERTVGTFKGELTSSRFSGAWTHNDKDAEACLSEKILSDLADQEAFFVTTEMFTELSFSDIQTFTVTEAGITFLFFPYQVGSYAQGGFEVFIPYTDLVAYIDAELLTMFQEGECKKS